MAENQPIDIEQVIATAQRLLDDGDWQAALRMLRAHRRRWPDEPRLHVLIGDCYSAAERWRQAVAAYERALEIAYDPDTAQRLEVAREQAAGQPLAFTITPKTLAIVFAALVLTMIATAIILWAAFGHREQPSQPPRPAGTPAPVIGRGTAPAPVQAASPWQLPSARPPLANQGPRGRAAQSRRASPTQAPPKPAAGPSAASLPPIRITKRVDAPATDRDWYLTDIVGSLSWPDGTPVAGNCLVQFDPYTGYAFVTIAIPRSLRTNNLAQVTLRMAQWVAWALMKADRSVKYVTVRALYAIEQPARRANTVVAFRGNTSRVAYEYWQRLGRQPNIQELWNEVFATCWWNPEVPASSEPRRK